MGFSTEAQAVKSAAEQYTEHLGHKEHSEFFFTLYRKLEHLPQYSHRVNFIYLEGVLQGVTVNDVKEHLNELSKLLSAGTPPPPPPLSAPPPSFEYREDRGHSGIPIPQQPLSTNPTLDSGPLNVRSAEAKVRAAERDPIIAYDLAHTIRNVQQAALHLGPYERTCQAWDAAKKGHEKKNTTLENAAYTAAAALFRAGYDKGRELPDPATLAKTPSRYGDLQGGVWGKMWIKRRNALRAAVPAAQKIAMLKAMSAHLDILDAGRQNVEIEAEQNTDVARGKSAQNILNAIHAVSITVPNAWSKCAKALEIAASAPCTAERLEEIGLLAILAEPEKYVGIQAKYDDITRLKQLAAWEYELGSLSSKNEDDAVDLFEACGNLLVIVRRGNDAWENTAFLPPEKVEDDGDHDTSAQMDMASPNAINLCFKAVRWISKRLMDRLVWSARIIVTPGKKAYEVGIARGMHDDVLRFLNGSCIDDGDEGDEGGGAAACLSVSQRQHEDEMVP